MCNPGHHDPLELPGSKQTALQTLWGEQQEQSFGLPSSHSCSYKPAIATVLASQAGISYQVSHLRQLESSTGHCLGLLQGMQPSQKITDRPPQKYHQLLADLCNVIVMINSNTRTQRQASECKLQRHKIIVAALRRIIKHKSIQVINKKPNIRMNIGLRERKDNLIQ